MSSPIPNPESITEALAVMSSPMPNPDNPAIAVLLASGQSILHAITLVIFGFYMAKRKFVTDTSMLAKISMELTIPCLLFTSVLDCTQNWSNEPCPSIVDTLVTAWPLLLLPFVYVMAGLFLGRVILWVAPPHQQFRRSVLAAVAFGNSTGLPITLLTVIHMSFHPSTTLGATDPILFLSIYLLVYPVLQWGIGGLLLRKPLQPPQTPQPQTPTDDCEASLECISNADCQLGGFQLPTGRKLSFLKSPVWTKLMQGTKEFLRPPVIASLAAIIISLIPGFRGIFVDDDERDNDACLQWAFNAARTMGRAAVPINMLILGGSLAHGASWRSIRWQTNLLIAFAKLVIMPSIGVGVVYFLKAILPSGTVTPALCLVALVVTGTPTANNVLVMVKLAEEDATAMSTCIFTQYILTPFCLTASITLFTTIAQQM